VSEGGETTGRWFGVGKKRGCVGGSVPWHGSEPGRAAHGGARCSGANRER
jgi:hypothetical protein